MERTPYYYEEEIDLREYVKTVWKYRYWIIALTLLAAISAFVVSSLLPPVYEAQSGLAMVRLRYEVEFEPKFKTLLGEENFKARQEALVSLAESNDVAVAVFEHYKDKLVSYGVEDVEGLREMVDAKQKGELILINVRAKDPELAAEIANVWAEEAEKHINSVYGQEVRSLEGLKAQVDEAKEQYEKAQSDLEDFLANSEIPALENEIKGTSSLLDSCRAVVVANEMALYSEEAKAKRELLKKYYGKLVAARSLLLEARVFRDLVSSTGTSEAMQWARALGFIRLQNEVSGVGTPQLQVVLAEAAPGLSVDDVNALVSSLEGKIDDLEEAITGVKEELSNSSLDGMNVSFSVQELRRLTDKLAELQSRLEAERARQKELENARNLAWDTYQTLSRKLAEQEVAKRAPEYEVKFATRALPPTRPVQPKRLMNTVIAGVLGLMLGVMGAFFAEYWNESEASEDDDE